MSIPLLSIIVFFPILACLGAWAFRRNESFNRRWSLCAAGFELLLASCLVVFPRDATAVGPWMRFEDYPWIDGLGVRFSLALDAISLLLVLLTAFLVLLCVLVSWTQVKEKIALFNCCLFFMQSAVMGIFLSTDLFVFYLFWELQLIPLFFMIGMWGHENRIYATIKFVLFSVAGSLFMLAAVIGLYLVNGSTTGHYTFSLFQLLQVAWSPSQELWFFAGFLLAFAIKIPLFPLHTWLPDAHTEAPTAGSVILAGLLLKTGAYALIRFAFPLFPHAAASAAPLIMALGLLGLFYASWIAWSQQDMKRLVAYSSIGHMGLLVVGIGVWSQLTLTGAILQMLNHGLTTSALFILVGMLDERAHTRRFADYGGLWKSMPLFSAFFLLFGMASMGLPGLNNFVGEILILVGAFEIHPWVGMAGFAGLVLVLVYVLRLIQDTLFGECRAQKELNDLSFREVVILAPLAVTVILLGLFPNPILDLLQGSVHTLVNTASRSAEVRNVVPMLPPL